MNRDPLEQLLRDADAKDLSTAQHSDLAERVRAVAARRARRAWLAAGGVVAGCVAAIVMWVAWPNPDQLTTPTQVVQTTTQPAADPRAELLAIAQEADRRAAMAEAMWAAERRVARPPRGAIAPDVASQVERAAFTMVYQAARMPVAGGAESPAADVYRQVSQSFPDTPSAQVARQRLNELTNRKDG